MIEAATFSIDVPDLEAGVAFYADGLGFEALGPAAADSFELRAGAVRIDLLERESGSDAVPADGDGAAARDYDRHWTPVHLDLVVDDVDDAVRRAVDAGATLESGPEDLGRERLARCVDPFGNGFCLLESLAE